MPERDMGNMIGIEAPQQIKDEVIGKARAAKAAARELAVISSDVKNKALAAMAQSLLDSEGSILEANEEDLDAARQSGISGALLDRLTLNHKRISAMAEGLTQLVGLPDPVGETIEMWKRPNGLEIGRVRVPLGVVGIIYEARPNVTVDAAGLCLKSGNAVILKGGSEALNSNREIVRVIGAAASDAGIPEGAISLIEATDRSAARVMMRLNGFIDVLIPRGGAGLIRTTVENSTVPVIETGVGNCHVFVDSDADLEMAESIVINAKTQRPGVCNAMETLLVDRPVAGEFLKRCIPALQERGVEIRGCQETQRICAQYGLQISGAVEDDWYEEYLDLILAVKVVDGFDRAVEHIHKYGSGHSEAIVTRDYGKARRFLSVVDAAAVYVNASTRFTDGFEFGMGAEIGISTQKLHARGPMGLKELTTTKFIVYGDGQIRS